MRWITSMNYRDIYKDSQRSEEKFLAMQELGGWQTEDHVSWQPLVHLLLSLLLWAKSQSLWLRVVLLLLLFCGYDSCQIVINMTRVALGKNEKDFVFHKDACLCSSGLSSPMTETSWCPYSSCRQWSHCCCSLRPSVCSPCKLPFSVDAQVSTLCFLPVWEGIRKSSGFVDESKFVTQPSES